jgi:hypothetical protein
MGERTDHTHLVGRLSNPSELLEAVLGWGPAAAGGAPRELAALAGTKRLGNGVLKRALIKALAVSDRPMGVCDAQMAVETLLGRAVSRDSVNSCLSTGVRGGLRDSLCSGPSCRGCASDRRRIRGPRHAAPHQALRGQSVYGDAMGISLGHQPGDVLERRLRFTLEDSHVHHRTNGESHGCLTGRH